MKNKLLLLSLGLSMITQMIYSQVPSYVPTNGLAGYWGFNGNANDQSGNSNNGTVNGASLTTDRFGSSNSAFNFDGLSNYINLNKQLPTIFTLSLWVNVSSYKSYSGAGYSNIGSQIIGTYNNNYGNSGFICVMNGLSTSYGQHGASFWHTGSYDTATATTNLNLNQWKNLIITFDGTYLNYFINGILEATVNATFTQNGRNLFVGAREFINNGPNFFFNGKIDDIGLWNRALNQQEITAMYNGVNYSDTCNSVSGSLVNGLVGYWPFCGNANDQSGNGNNGIVNGATLSTDRFGNTNSAYSFDGVDDFIYNNNWSSLNGSQDFSVNFWLKYLPSTGWMVSFGQPQNSNAFHIGTAFLSSNLYSAFWNFNYNPITNNYPFLNLDSNWMMITIVYNNDSIQQFKNGVLQTTFSSNNLNENLLPGQLNFGKQIGNYDEYFNGQLDDIGIWNRALTQQEITQLFSQNQCTTNITVTDTLIINVGQLSYSNPITYANNITIYPNPASTQVNISFNNITNLTGGNINVINSLGQQVATTPITLSGTNTTMPLNTWGGTGLYFVQIVNAQGKILDIKKIILQ